MKIAETPYFVQILLDLSPELHLDEELLRAVAQVNLSELLQASCGRPGDQFTKMMCAAMTAESRPADLALLARIEEHVGASTSNRAEFVSACPDYMVMECFEKIKYTRSTNFARFDAQMTRLMACLGREDSAPDAIAGMRPSEYWSQMVACCESFDNDDGETAHVSDTQPAHWAAWLHHAVDHGMSPTSPVARQGEWPAFETGRTETFREAIEARCGAGCVAMFDAIVVERSMEARLRLNGIGEGGTINPEPSARRRGPL